MDRPHRLCRRGVVRSWGGRRRGFILLLLLGRSEKGSGDKEVDGCALDGKRGMGYKIEMCGIASALIDIEP